VDEAALAQLDQALGGDFQGVAVEREFQVVAQPTPGQRVEPDRAPQRDIADRRQGRRGQRGVLASEKLAEHQSGPTNDNLPLCTTLMARAKGAAPLPTCHAA
jgi:hypothetical protein